MMNFNGSEKRSRFLKEVKPKLFPAALRNGGVISIYVQRMVSLMKLKSELTFLPWMIRHKDFVKQKLPFLLDHLVPVKLL